MSVYILSGKDIYRIEENLKHILSNHGIDKEHTVYFDGSDKKNFRLEAAILECDSFSLFDEDPKAVIIRDPFFLSASKKSDETGAKKKTDKEQEQRISLLEQYLKQPSEKTVLVFYCTGFEADSRKKEYKLLQKYHAEVLRLQKMKKWEFENYTDKQLSLNGLRLTRDARSELLNRVDGDTLLLHNAIDKMALYGKKDLDLDDISHLVSLNPEVNVFQMSNAFIRGDLAKVLRARDEMLDNSYDYQSMIAMLASRLRAYYEYKLLYEKGLNDSEITMRTHANEYAVKISLEAMSSLRSRTILEWLGELAQLDQDIKAGKADAANGFEMFLLRNGKR